MPTVTTRYPSGPITLAGACNLLNGNQPMFAYRSYDDAVVFNMIGPMALWDNYLAPESIRLMELKGLIPPWQHIEQKGATQDGNTYVTSLYEPMEVEMTVEARGKTPSSTRKLVRDWIASWDAKRTGTLSWFSAEMGYWWADVRLNKHPLDSFTGLNFTRQKFTWSAKCNSAFWRSYDSTDVFAYSYRNAVEHFTTDTSATHDLGSNWTLAYGGAGSGYIYADGTQAVSTLVGGRSVVARRVGFTSATDMQIVTMTIGKIDPWPSATDTHLDLWARMANTGTPGQDGVRLRIGYRSSIGTGKHPGTTFTPTLELSYFVGGVQTVLRETDVTVPWQPTDQISLAVGGFSGAEFSYYVQRGTNTTGGTHNVTWQTLMTVVHTTPDGSHTGASYRGAGFGMESDGSIVPASVFNWTAGDSTAAEEGGYVTLYNVGDQNMWPYFILVGPGEFAIGDGPNATSAVVYGPLETNQIVMLRTDPRRYAVTDLTSLPPPGTPNNQFLSNLAAALAEYNSFLSNSNAPSPHLSPFGTPFPQGNPYSLLDGRFSRPIPAKQPGSPAQPQQIAVAVESGGPTTAILAGGVPLRRYPL
jgi:hypothetical protein